MRQKDLFYRLSGISFTIPSLRERRAETAALSRMFLARYEQSAGNQTHAAEALGISRRTLVYRLSELGVPRPRKR
ncbi:MAG TPA: helix-turn-helix domain-containing protein [Polyangiaceae bacterium]|nr:helix-turn-helix domain-containing protein [Polyangiaceae bacterium]